MYLAPLNYDRYFKRVFSDLKIAKRFLEDFFDITIETINLLDIHHKITDDAVAIEFDFQCKIDNQFVIIDMPQWYKPDVVHRFYTYHCINTALQLENLPFKSIALEGDKERKVKDYNEIMPVITFVWMVDDTFGFKEDFISYNMTPEIVLEFIKNHLLWQNKDITELLKQRELALIQLSNKAKKLDFLQKNRLIYAFQKNIVANSQKKDSKYNKYLNWFELAEKTKNKLNEKSDFLKYAEDEIFAELIRRICKDTLTEEDYTYIDNYEQFTERVKRYDQVIYQEGREEGVQIGMEKGREEEGEKQRQEKLEMVREMLNEGMSDNQVAKIIKVDISEIQKIRKQIETNDE